MIGKTARVCFKNPEEFAGIVNLPVDLVRDMAAMLDALSSGHDLNPDAFQALADSWMDRFHATSASDETNMTWNWFSPYVHMLMVHASEIIRYLPIPPGLLSEVHTDNQFISYLVIVYFCENSYILLHNMHKLGRFASFRI